MADQNSIASILAALNQAQQRQAASSAPDPRSMPPQPPSRQHMQAPLPSQSYGYPPPSSSGAIDLSSLQPSNSGSMSFQDPRGAYPDAMRSPYTDSRDGKYGGGYDDRYRRRYSRSRSRSRERSPYGHRRRDRERSYSPGRRGTTPTRDTMVIDIAFVGLVIGRGGDSLRRIEGETGARVQFVPDESKTAKYRTCNISGTSLQVRAARHAMQTIINDNIALKAAQGKLSGSLAGAKVTPAAGQLTTQIRVPDPTVGLVIGRGGETIRELQDKSGCHINIVAESQSVNGMRPVNLIGSPEAIRRAQDLIEEIVNSDTNGRPRATSAVNDPTALITEVIKVPMDSVGMIIGKGGETVKEMQHNTQCKINVSSQYQPSDPTRDITLNGTGETIQRAKAAIQEKIDLVNARKAAASATSSNTQYPSYGAPSAADSSSYAGYGSGAAAGSAAAQPYSSQSPGVQQGGAQADPYAAYGGYQNYIALWQQWQQQQQQQPSGQSDQPS